MELLGISQLQHAADMADRRQIPIGDFDRRRVGVLDVQPDRQPFSIEPFFDAGGFEDQHRAVAGLGPLDVGFDDLEGVLARLENVAAAGAGVDARCVEVDSYYCSALLRRFWQHYECCACSGLAPLQLPICSYPAHNCHLPRYGR